MNPVLALFLLLALLGCGRDAQFIYHKVEPPPDYFTAIHKLKELQGESKVDILFIVDNSGSMGTYQQALIRNADTFINDFVTKGGLDWKIGVISTDVTNQPFVGMAPGNELKFSTPDNIQLFKNAVGRLGTSGDPIEKTFAPTMKWLKQYPGFLRPNAILALIMVTDAEEQSNMPAQDFIDFLDQTKGLKKVVSYGVFSPQDFGCTIADSTWNYKNSPYEKVITATTGKTYALCKDFGTNLADLGQDLVSRVSRPSIRLSSRPQLKTLTVNYHGQALKGGPESEGGLWIYDFDLNSIRFHNLDFAPGENEEVEVEYEVAK